MATHDYVIANASGAAVRADLNNALAAIVSNNSSTTEPATTYAYMWWADTTSGQLKQRNAANDGWVVVRELDGTMLMEDGSAAAPGLAFASDPNSGFFSAGADQLGIATNGVERVEFGTSEVVFNDGGEDIDFRIEGDTEANLFFVDAGADTVSFRDDVYIDSSGRLLVGTSTAAGDAKLQIQGDAASSTTRGLLSLLVGSSSPADGAGLGRIDYTDSAGTRGASILAARDGGTWSASSAPTRLLFSTTADGDPSPTERMRIASNGDILFNTTTETVNSNSGVTFNTSSSGRMIIDCGTTATSSSQIQRFFNGNGQVGSIATSGNSTAFNTSSDYRLKENVIPLTGAAERVNQLQVHRFNFIADPGTTVDGFIAHEAQAIVPECVTGTKDEVDDEGNPVYQGIDQSKLVPLLTAALQEALQKIETQAGVITALDARLTALEGGAN